MFTNSPKPNVQLTVEKALHTSRILWAALIAGVVAFFVVTLGVKQQAPLEPQVAYIGLIFAVIAVGASLIAPSIGTKSQLRDLQKSNQPPTDVSLFGIFQTRMIIGLAILEGACFFNLVCFMNERQWWSVAVVGGLVLLMALKFPTMQAFLTFADDTRRDLQNQF